MAKENIETLRVTRFKSMKAALLEIRPFVMTPRLLEVGDPIDALGGLRPRELLANWLICAAYNDAAKSEDLCFTTDPKGGDEGHDLGRLDQLERESHPISALVAYLFLSFEETATPKK